MNTRKEEPIPLLPVEPLEVDWLRLQEPSRRWWIWLVYMLLFGVSVPWYLPGGSQPQIWLGLPHWVVISLLATIGIALFTVVVINRYWADPVPPNTSSEREDQHV